MAVKKTTTAKKAAEPKNATTKKAGRPKAVKATAVIQYGGLEFSEADCVKKAQAGFKKQFKGKELEKINIYIKPEEHKIYFVGNTDCVGSVDL